MRHQQQHDLSRALKANDGDADPGIHLIFAITKLLDDDESDEDAKTLEPEPARAVFLPRDGNADDGGTSHEQQQALAKLKGIDVILSTLRQRPLPLLTKDELIFYQGRIASIVMRLYRDRIIPDVAVIKQRMRLNGYPEPVVRAVLLLCVHDCPHIYNIQLQMNALLVIYLSKAPLWFQGFPDFKDLEKSAVGSRLNDAVWASMDLFLQNCAAVLPAVHSQAALVLDDLPGLCWLSVEELEHLNLLAIHKGKLKFFGDYLLPKRVATTYHKQLYKQCIEPFNAQRFARFAMPEMKLDDCSFQVSNSTAPTQADVQPKMKAKARSVVAVPLPAGLVTRDQTQQLLCRHNSAP